MTRALIIAEAGVNHNGDLSVALQLVDAAVAAGADVVKFQTFSAERLATKLAPRAAYQVDKTLSNDSQLEMLRRLELTPAMHVALLDRCKSSGIQFLSSGFDIQSIENLSNYDPPFYKIPSGEITNLPYLRYVGHFGKEIILSSGMSTILEIEEALEVLAKSGTSREKITVLHCTTDYPTHLCDVNLRAMLQIRDMLGVKVGYSDHTLGLLTPVAAVAMGASIIEKHFTLNRSSLGPDHKASLTPGELKEMITAIRDVELLMGGHIKRPSAVEKSNKLIVRKSIVASQDISEGTEFTEENLTTKRPGTGLSPMLWDSVIGRRAKRDFTVDEMIEL